MKTNALPHGILILLLLFLAPAGKTEAQIRSTLYPSNWTPGYTDAGGRFLHDFSYAGYRKSEVPFPNVTGPNFINAITAPYHADETGAIDSTAVIQQALDDVGMGGGGVVYLPSGTFKVKPQTGNDYCLRIKYNNVVLRGAGMGQTFLYCDETYTRGKAVVLMRPLTDVWWYGGTNAATITQDLLMPAKVLPVNSVSGYAVGDYVAIRTDLTQAFINDHGMQAYWAANDPTIRGVTLARRITAIDAAAQTLTIDAPTRYWMKTRDSAAVYKLSNTNLRESGVEKLSIGMKENLKSGWGADDYTINGTGAYDANLSSAVTALYCEDCWIVEVGSYKPPGNTGNYHLMSNGIVLNYSRQVTVAGCSMQLPKCLEVGGGNGYLYELASNDCLVRDSYAYKGRHNMDMQTMRCSGNVFYNNTAAWGYLMSDYHMYLSTANLHDNTICDTETLSAVYHNGGSPRHGQTSSQCVYWNTRGDAYNWRNYIVISQQFGNGYVVGTRGAAPAVYTTTDDFLEHIGNGGNLQPSSLWQDQLQRRTGGPLIASVSVTSGKTYPVTNDLGVGDKVYIESTDATTYSLVPAIVQGATFLQTSRTDYPDTGANFMTLTLARAADLYVGYRAGQTKPGWLDASWTDLGVDLDTFTGATTMHMRLYRKTFPAGTVVLGGNKQGGGGSSMMYVVCAKPALVAGVSAASGKIYPVVDGLGTGDKVYLETFNLATYASVPAEVQGAAFLQTSRGDYTDASASFLNITLGLPAHVYVGYRSGQTKPGWLDATWIDTGVDLDTSENMHMRLYKKTFPAGSAVLGGNAQGGGSSTMMYVVAVKAQ